METESSTSTKPTFCFEDVHERLFVFYPDDYERFEYSNDGNWVTLECREPDGRLVRRTFFIGYPA